ncbi:hypothetical protein XH94_26180 [Bradyrhizobium zhanjiangense]|uniref:Uncharacterized protein n=1 Tax=Bradyrhizobium zhanjiangense TaxID=1325107 RepID=A0A4Q0SD38_9BRAD|nr:hypothetical protein XH94_26180 [Bradyrhizobium zhanjiangense]
MTARDGAVLKASREVMSMLTARFRTSKIRENNPMHSRNGRIGPICQAENLRQRLAKFVI